MTWVDDFCENPQWSTSDLVGKLSLTGLTPCFEAVIIRGTVNLTFLVLLPIRLYQVAKARKLRIAVLPTWLHYVKALCALVNALVPAFLINGMLASHTWAVFELVTEPVTCFSWLLALITMLAENKRWVPGTRWIMQFLSLFALAGDIVRFRTALLLSDARGLDYFFVLHCIGFSFMCLLVLLQYFVRENDFKVAELLRDQGDHEVDVEMVIMSQRRRRSTVSGGIEDTKRPSNPEDGANIWSRVWFNWLSPLIDLGYKVPLQDEHIWPLSETRRTDYVRKRFDAAWDLELTKPKPSLWRAMWKTSGAYYSLGGFYLLIQNLAQYVPPVLLQFLIKYLMTSNRASQTQSTGYLLALGMFGGTMLMALAENQFFDVVTKVGVDVRSALVSSIFRKALRLSNKARQERSIGAITNHMTSDTEKIQLLTTVLHNIWSSPMRIVIGMYLLGSSNLSYSVIVGFLLLLVLIPLQARVMTKLAALTKGAMKEADGRIKTINEVLSSMLVIKYYTWEGSFLQRVLSNREKELVWIKKLSLVRGATLLLIGLNPIALSVGTFAAFAIINGDLDAATAFFALSMFNLLFWPILLLPRSISSLLETNVSIRRIEAFLTAEELQDSNALTNSPAPAGTVSIKDGNFNWGTTPILRNVNLDIRPGELVAVIGSTGSGKSSLLSAILREMNCVSGSVGVKGSVAYVPQQAWIFNATVRENITFGLDWEEDRYLKCVQNCCLLPDFSQFGPARDETEIGEKGINLSGGQKQRVNVARAVYANADVYMFDDPLSALDAHVGSKLFHSCIKSHLAGKTRLLVTNQLQYLPEVDRIVVVKEGKLIGVGTYNELLNTNADFQHMVRELGSVEETPVESDAKADDAAHAELEAARAQLSSPILKDARTAGKLVEAEHREVGGVTWAVYDSYIKAAGGARFFVGMAVPLLLGEAARVGSSFWLGVWSANALGATVAVYMGVYFGLSLMQTVLSGVVSVVGAFGSTSASRVLHERMLRRILKAPMSFFDSTPLGRLINRFTKDISALDQSLMFNVNLFLGGVVRLIGTLVIIAIVSPYAIVTFVPVLFVFFFIQRKFQTASRELKRLDSVSRSPVYAHFTESLDGMSTIRAYMAQERSLVANAAKLDRNQAVYLIHMTVNRWLSMRLELLGGIMFMAAAVFGILSTDGAQLVGLSLSYAMSITTQLNMMVRMSTETENSFNSVERIKEYCEVPQEAGSEGTSKPPSSWPAQGRLSLKNVVMSYRPGAPQVLRGLTLDVEPGFKIGVVGRTGAGKSSLFQCLFRIAESEPGSVIEFDGIDTRSLELQDVRQAIAVIPQSPVLFSGTLRSNLDPFSTYDDAKLWEVLERAQLKHVVMGHPAKLDMPVAENGENFSVGQRQLVCLARALLRQTKFLLVDEATANVDVETDALIQKTLRSEFQGITTMTIAHRLNTIIDCDRILVMGAGRVLEFDSPARLLSNPNSEFSALVRETGPRNEAYLRSVVAGEISVIASLAPLADKAVEEMQSVRPVRGPLATGVDQALDVVLSALETRHSQQWQDEYAASHVSETMWLNHLFSRLNELHQLALAAAAEDNIDFDSVSDQWVTQHNLNDMQQPIGMDA